MTQDEVRQKLDRALEKLVKCDRDLLIRDVNERSITHRLAIYLQEEFPEMNVDCEYNRYGSVSKKLEFYPPQADTHDTNARTVFPDIIVHKRGPDGPNLLVIEAKKSTNDDSGKDIEKLKAYKSDDTFRYEHAVFLVFRVGNDPGVEAVKFF